MSPLTRREFVTAGVAAGAGLVVGFYLPHRGRTNGDRFSPNAIRRRVEAPVFARPGIPCARRALRRARC